MNRTQRLSLDVAAPDEVSDILRRAADAYRESQTELQSAWQDRSADSEWSKIARILESAAQKIDKIIG